MKFFISRETISRGLSIVVLCGIVAVSACAGREPHPIAATNATDSQFDCAGLSREFAANERSVIAINKEKSGADAKNIAFGVTGVILFWPALFLMDPKSPERVEIDALRNRNLVVTDIARTKGCSLPKSQLDEYYKRLKSAPVSKSRN
ncbi:hypothetical protein LJR231_004610 [Phyllobacterium sp. LjRoot231]|uniref:hypothetical protein n=1 Tax=Phyllobacterium sp. LjRoot231 TaxID=3342289 RepID=UPI003ED0E020